MLPLLYEVGVHTYSEGPSDGYGPTVVYTPPKDDPGVAVKVYGWSVPSSTEPPEEQGNLVVIDVELLAPAGFVVSPHDVIDLPDGQYEVIGAAEDFTHGPFGTAFGILVKLCRVEG